MDPTGTTEVKPADSEDSAAKPQEQAASTSQETPEQLQARITAMSVALKKANKEAETLRLKAKESADKDLSDLEKAKKDLLEVQVERDAAKLEAERASVVIAKKVPADLADFVTGSTREEMEARADRLLSAIPTAVSGKPKPDPSQGPRGTTIKGLDAGRAEAERRFGKSAERK